MRNRGLTAYALVLCALAAPSIAPALADLADTVSAVEPSVVTVIASRDLGGGRSQHTFGSGFFITPTDIVTTARVLNGATSARVVTYLEERLTASVVGVDLASRLAVLRIAEPIGVPANMAPGPEVRKGEAVFTLGSHLGMGLTVTGGMVNGVARTVTTSGLPSVNDAFQIDAPVSADASGAPVFDEQGRVRGIVLLSLIPDRGTVYRPPDEGAAPLSEALVPGGLDRDTSRPESTSPESALAAVVTFCLPADTVSYVTTQLRQTGSVRRGVLGLEMSPVPATLAAHLGIDPRGGAMVVAVTEGGPAERAGLKPFDIVLGLGGVPSAGVRQIVKALQTRPGEVVPLTVLRGAETVSLAVEVGEMIYDSPTRELVTGGGEPMGWFGVRGEMVDAALAAHSHVLEGRGLAVAYVFPDSPAARAGVVAGDIILEILGGDAQPFSALPFGERLQHQVRGASPGSSLTIVISRLGAAEPAHVDVTIDEMPDAQRLMLSSPAYAGTGIAF